MYYPTFLCIIWISKQCEISMRYTITQKLPNLFKDIAGLWHIFIPVARGCHEHVKVDAELMNLRMISNSAPGKSNSFIAVVSRLNHNFIYNLWIEFGTEMSDKTVVNVGIGDLTSNDKEPTMTRSSSIFSNLDEKYFY